MNNFLSNLRFHLKINWKVMLITVVAGFLMSVLPRLGLKVEGFAFTTSASIVSPLPKTEDPLRFIYPLLEKKLNEFKLKREAAFIQQAHAGSDYESALSFIVLDFESGKVIEEKNSDQPLPMASLTKVMTAVVALDLAKPEETLLVSPKASRIEPTKIGVVPGQILTLQEALEAMLMTSANDAAQVIMEGINSKYNSDVFVQAMNAKARFLNLEHTSFSNPQGFDDDNHYSSSEDLAILTHYAMANYPLISQIVQKDYEVLQANGNHKQFDLYNWNGLLGVYPGVRGVKIGNTDRAQKTTIVVSEREGKQVLAVLLGAPGIIERDLWTAHLLDDGFAKGFNLEPVGITKEQLKQKYSTWKYWN